MNEINFDQKHNWTIIDNRYRCTRCPALLNTYIHKLKFEEKYPTCLDYLASVHPYYRTIKESTPTIMIQVHDLQWTKKGNFFWDTTYKKYYIKVLYRENIRSASSWYAEFSFNRNAPSSTTPDIHITKNWSMEEKEDIQEAINKYLKELQTITWP